MTPPPVFGAERPHPPVRAPKAHETGGGVTRGQNLRSRSDVSFIAERHPERSEGSDVLDPYLKPSVKTISLRLPEAMLDEIKVLANKRDVPYQSLLKIFLAERIAREFSHPEPRAA